MTTEKADEVSAVGDMTSQEMAKIIKTVKKESESQGKDTVSICDVMKNNTTEIIEKIETKFPIYAQLYTDLYTKYLHTISDLYSTCYLSEKEFFDKLGMNKPAIQAFDTYWKSVTNIVLSQIDMGTNFAKMYVQFRLGIIDSYDKVAHMMMDNCARAWSQFNSYNKK